jgi:hypothetical protein
MELIRMLKLSNIMFRVSKQSKKNRVKTLTKSWLLSRKIKKICHLLRIHWRAKTLQMEAWLILILDVDVVATKATAQTTAHLAVSPT